MFDAGKTRMIGYRMVKKKLEHTQHTPVSRYHRLKREIVFSDATNPIWRTAVTLKIVFCLYLRDILFD